MSFENNAASERELPTILFVDDEEKTRKHFLRLFQKQFRIVVAGDGVEALRVFQAEADRISVIVTDQRMPNETGTEFLQKAALIKPGVVRILSTAYADVDAAIDSVNKSGIYRYITKPWEVPELEVTLNRAVELFELQSERDELQRQKMTSLQNLAASERIHSLAALAVFQNTGIRHVSRALKTLVDLADQPGNANTGEAPQWSDLFTWHRHFLQVAHANLPGDLATRATPSPTAPVSVGPILQKVIDSDPHFRWLEPNSNEILWPGPEEVLSGIIHSFLSGIAGILTQADAVNLSVTASGVDLNLSALALQHGLHPLLQPNFPDGPDKNRALGLVATFLEWSHHGGLTHVLPDHGTRTVTLRLSLTPPESASDPWESLAADLVSNDLFWQRHLD